MELEYMDPRAFDKFFVDPDVGEDGILRPPRRGVACQNVRTALRMLGYEVEFGDSYDNELAQIVLQFQTDSGHSSRDGNFGPGTREKLVDKFLSEFGPEIFGRLQRPAVRLFVSYRREDAARISGYLDALRNWGIRVWFDKEIPGGTRWAEKLEAEMTKCDVMLIFLSQAAFESEYVQNEFQFAASLNKPILPVRLDSSDPSHGWGVLLSSRQILDASETEFLPNLKRAIENTVGWFAPSSDSG